MRQKKKKKKGIIIVCLVHAYKQMFGYIKLLNWYHFKININMYPQRVQTVIYMLFEIAPALTILDSGGK